MPDPAGPRILVLGAGAAGLKAAARAARLLPDAAITVVDRREFISLRRLRSALLLGGEVTDLDDLRRTSYGAVRDPACFSRRQGHRACSPVAWWRPSTATSGPSAVRRRPTTPAPCSCTTSSSYATGAGGGTRGRGPGRRGHCTGSTPEDVGSLRHGLERARSTRPRWSSAAAWWGGDGRGHGRPVGLRGRPRRGRRPPAAAGARRRHGRRWWRPHLARAGRHRAHGLAGGRGAHRDGRATIDPRRR